MYRLPSMKHYHKNKGCWTPEENKSITKRDWQREEKWQWPWSYEARCRRVCQTTSRGWVQRRSWRSLLSSPAGSPCSAPPATVRSACSWSAPARCSCTEHTQRQAFFMHWTHIQLHRSCLANARFQHDNTQRSTVVTQQYEISLTQQHTQRDLQ